LGSGVKYLMRSDVMFERLDTPLVSEKERRALELIKQAEDTERGGDCMKAMELYRRAFKLCPEMQNKY